MSIESFPFTTVSGVSPYTQSQLHNWLARTFLNNPATEGVLVGFGGEFAVTGTSSPITVASGAAYINGVFMSSDSDTSINVSTPVIGTTAHRVVLRANLTAPGSTEVDLVSSSDGVATPPALTQVANTTWEISLATLTITTGGVITVTDTRQYAHFATRIATQNLDNDAVDDTKVGNRVPQFYRRQGGNASNWSTSGTTTYTPTTVRQQAGNAHWSNGFGVIIGSLNVTFPVAFSNAPLVYVQPKGVSIDRIVTVITALSTTGFTVEWYSVYGGGGHTSIDFMWFAIGPE